MLVSTLATLFAKQKPKQIKVIPKHTHSHTDIVLQAWVTKNPVTYKTWENLWKVKFIYKNKGIQ